MRTGSSYRIAAIAGDGIGQEVLPEGLRVLDATAVAFGLNLEVAHFEFASCEYYLQHGQMLPDDWKAQLGDYDAILFGAVGWPQTVPDHVSLWGSILKFRRGFDQYVGLRPVRLMTGVQSPLRGRTAADIDLVIVRENTEGEYSSIGGRMFEGTERETVIQETVMTRVGVDRIIRYGFELASRREAKHLTSATKSNGISITMPYWDERVEVIAAEFPEVGWDKMHIDALCAQLVMEPSRFDVIVASNLFGDILSDLGPACTGTIGIAPSANLNPGGEFPSLFEPVHGSAPDIAGRGIANPVGQIWAVQLMLTHFGETSAAEGVLRAIERGLADPRTRTADLGGTATTERAGKAIADAVHSAATTSKSA